MGSYSGVVVQMWNASTLKEERRGSGAQGQPELHESWVEQKQDQKDDLVNTFAYFPHKIMKCFFILPMEHGLENTLHDQAELSNVLCDTDVFVYEGPWQFLLF